MNLDIEHIKQLTEAKNAKALIKLFSKFLKLWHKRFSKLREKYDLGAVVELFNKALIISYPESRNAVIKYIKQNEPYYISLLKLYYEQTQDFELVKVIIKKAKRTKRKTRLFLDYLDNLSDFNESVLSQIDDKDIKYLLNEIEKKLYGFELVEDGDIRGIINLFKKIKSKEKEPFIIKILKGTEDAEGCVWVGKIIRNDEEYDRKDEIETLLINYLQEEQALNSFSDSDQKGALERQDACEGLRSLKSIKAIPNMIKVIEHVANWRWYQNAGDDEEPLVYLDYFVAIKENIPASMKSSCIESLESISMLDYAGIGSLPSVPEIQDKCNMIIDYLKN